MATKRVEEMNKMKIYVITKTIYLAFKILKETPKAII